MSFGKRLQSIRENHMGNISKAKAASMLNITPQRYGQYENDYRTPDIKMISKICNVFDISADYLLGRVDVPTPYNNEGRSIDIELKDILDKLDIDENLMFEEEELDKNDRILIGEIVRSLMRIMKRVKDK